MRFKLDENLPLEAAASLQTAGHDALTVYDQQLAGVADPRIASVCHSENRAIVTLDLDFADIRAYPPGNYHGIVVLRPRRQSKPAVLNLIAQLVPLLDQEPLDGKLWILQESGLRIREP